MRRWLRGVCAFVHRRQVVWYLVLCVGLVEPGLAASTGISREEEGRHVPAEEYPVFDAIVESKFLTSATRVVVVARETATRMHPADTDPPTRQWFEDVRPFNHPLPDDVLHEFVVKNHQSTRLEGRFEIGVTVRFVTADGRPEPEVRWRRSERLGSTWLRNHGPVPVLERLAFSRVAFDRSARHALVYVSQERPDGSGAGFLFWSERTGEGLGRWRVLETDVLWVARPDPDRPPDADPNAEGDDEMQEEFDRG